MDKRVAEAAFQLVKSYVEAVNSRCAVSTESGRVCVRHKDGTRFKSCGGMRTIYYRSAADFVRMLLGCETDASMKFRKQNMSPKLVPIAYSVEELRLKYELKFGWAFS